MADYELTERVLLNLLDNAIRHSPDGSKIDIDAEILEGFLRIVVKDQGEGITPELLPFVFEKYTRGNHANHGDQRSYGLGLAFCKMAVETHGGKIGAISEQGKGSEFWFTMPLASGAIVETICQSLPPVFSHEQEFPKLTDDEIAYMREHYRMIGQLSIHQISDIKDLLKKPDEITSTGIRQWKKAVITSINQYDSKRFNNLKELLTKDDGQNSDCR